MNKTVKSIVAMILIAVLLPINYPTYASFGSSKESGDIGYALSANLLNTLEFDNNGEYPWTVSEFPDRIAARSGNVAEADTTSNIGLTIEMTAGQALIFDYKVSSELNWDVFSFRVNNDEIFVDSGITDWKHGAYIAQSDGSYSFTWEYSKDSSGDAGEDSAWFDNVDIIDETDVVTGIEYSNSDFSVSLGGEKTVELTALPITATEVRYSAYSDDKNITEVSVEGNVLKLRGVAYGSTTVTITENGGYETAIPVNVTEPIEATGYLLHSNTGGNVRSWYSFEIVNGVTEHLYNDTGAYYAADYAYENLYAWNTDGSIYLIDRSTQTRTAVAETNTAFPNIVFCDMSYDYSEDIMYMLGTNENNNDRGLYTFNPSTKELALVSLIVDCADIPMTLACSTDGVIYVIDGIGVLYTVDKQTADVTLVGLTGISAEYIQSMSFDHSNEVLYWAAYTSASAAIYTVDTTTALVTKLFDSVGEIACFSFPYIENNYDDVSEITLNNNSLTLDWNESRTLIANILPSSANQAIRWSTTDSKVATVTSEGVVFGRSAGTAEITATSCDGTHTAKCMVTVVNAPVYELFESFEGQIIGWETIDADGDGQSWLVQNSSSDLGSAYDGDRMMVSESYVAGTTIPLEADNWLVSPEMTLPASSVLEWHVQSPNELWLDSYQVYICTVEPDETVTEDSFETLLYDGRPNADGKWSEMSVPLDEYVGQTVRIAFRHHDSGKLAVKLDYVALMYVESDIKFSVTFKDSDGTVLKSETVAEGCCATPPVMTDKENEIFAGWDGSYTNVRQNLVLTAQYGVMGDVNRDGKVNTGDATCVLRSSVGLVALDITQTKLGDVNHDGKVNTGDAVTILKRSVGM